MEHYKGQYEQKYVLKQLKSVLTVLFLGLKKKVHPIISCCKCCLNFVHILSYRNSKEGYLQIPMSSQQSNMPVWNSEGSYLPGWLTTAMITLKSSLCGMKKGYSYCLITACEKEEHYTVVFLLVPRFLFLFFLYYPRYFRTFLGLATFTYTYFKQHSNSKMLSSYWAITII